MAHATTWAAPASPPTPFPQLTPNLTFQDAALIWLADRMPYICPRTVNTYREYIAALLPHFARLRLSDINVGHLRDYQRNRKAGSSRINHELNTVRQILARVGLWQDIAPHYEQLPAPKWIPPRVMTPDEEQRLFQVAASNPDWDVAYWASLLSANTTATGCEIRGLRLRHVDLKQGILYVPSDAVKNEFRARTIPLNEDAARAARALVDRAIRLGSRNPDHYLLPYRVKRNHYDPTRHTEGWRTAFREMRSAADIPWLRPHDLRHHAITKLLENPNISEETVKAIAGHVSPRILNTYSHIRIHRKREALAQLTSQGFQRRPVGSFR